MNNSGTLQWNGSPLAIGGSISGTTNTVPLFTASNAIGNSIMTQSGTTITVANTLSATTLTGTLSTVSQPNVTTMAALASIGTITTGVWNGTAVGVQWGGTGSNLSGTGGTSQFLRQNTVGAAVTVVRPAVADLSDNSNIFLLNANNTVTAGGTQTISAGFTGNELLTVNNTAAGTGNSATLSVANDSPHSASLQVAATTFTPSGDLLADGARLIFGGVGGLSITTTGGSAAMRFYTGGFNQRWGINSAGDFTFGASSHLADSSGTPTYSSGGGGSATINGTDYAMQVNAGGASTSVTLNFGHTWSNVPVCVVVVANGAAAGSGLATMTTSQVTVSWTNSVAATFNMLCRGF